MACYMAAGSYMCLMQEQNGFEVRADLQPPIFRLISGPVSR